jgi:hypothetical protein
MGVYFQDMYSVYQAKKVTKGIIQALEELDYEVVCENGRKKVSLLNGKIEIIESEKEEEKLVEDTRVFGNGDGGKGWNISAEKRK